MCLIPFLLIISQGAKVIFEKREYEILNDTIMVKDVYKEILIQNKSVSSRYGFEEILYDENFDSVIIFKAQTISKEGEISEVTPNAINTVSPEEIEDYPEFSNIKKIVISFLNIDDNSKLIIHYKIVSKIKYLYEMIKITREIPVEKVLIIVNPNDKEIKYRTSRDLNVRKKGNIIIFEGDSISPLIYEPFLPPYELYLSFVEFTDLDWERFGEFIRGMLVDEDTITISLNSIFDLKKIDISDRFINFSLRSKNEIFKSGRGTYLERMKLLYSFYLDSLKIVLVYNPYIFNPDFPSLNFEAILLYDDSMYISPDYRTNSKEPFIFSGDMFVYFDSDTFEIKKIGEFSKRMISEKIEFNLKKSEMECEISMDSSTFEKVKEIYENDSEDIINQLNIYFKKISELNINKQKRILKIKGQRYFLSQGDFILIPLKEVRLSSFNIPRYDFYKKVFPLYIYESFIFSYTIRLFNLDGEIIYPYDFSVKNDLYAYSEKYEINNNELKCYFDIEYNRGLITQENLDEFKEFVRKSGMYNKFILIKK